MGVRKGLGGGGRRPPHHDGVGGGWPPTHHRQGSGGSHTALGREKWGGGKIGIRKLRRTCALWKLEFGNWRTWLSPWVKPARVLSLRKPYRAAPRRHGAAPAPPRPTPPRPAQDPAAARAPQGHVALHGLDAPALGSCHMGDTAAHGRNGKLVHIHDVRTQGDTCGRRQAGTHARTPRRCLSGATCINMFARCIAKHFIFLRKDGPFFKKIR